MQVLRIVHYRCSACINLCELRSVVYVPLVRALVQSLLSRIARGRCMMSQSRYYGTWAVTSGGMTWLISLRDRESVPLLARSVPRRKKGVFVFCYMSGKDIAQSSGESGAWYWCIAQGERRVQCGHLADTARTQGQGGGISCMVGSGRCTCTLSIRYRLILGGMDTFVFAKRCTGRTRGTFQPLCPPILREG